jgi:hypothetical protein
MNPIGIINRIGKINPIYKLIPITKIIIDQLTTLVNNNSSGYNGGGQPPISVTKFLRRAMSEPSFFLNFKKLFCRVIDILITLQNLSLPFHYLKRYAQRSPVGFANYFTKPPAQLENSRYCFQDDIK